MFKYQGKKIDISRDLVFTRELTRIEGEGDEAREVKFTETFIEPADNLLNAERRAELGITEEPDPVRPDDTYHYVSEREDGGFDVTPKPVDQVGAVKLQQVNGQCESLLAGVKAGYPQGEVESWSKQEAEARAWLAKNTAATPLVDGLCAARGIDKAELVGRIVAKADAYAAVVGVIVGRRQAFEDQIATLIAANDFDGLIGLQPTEGWPAL